MIRGPINSNSLKWSLILHGILLLAALLLPFLPRFQKKEVALPLDFTVVLEENLEEPDIKPPAIVPPVVSPPAPEPEPVKPIELPEPLKEAVVVKKVKEVVKKPVVKPPEPTKKVKPPETKPFVKGKRVEAVAPKPKIDFTKLTPVTSKPVTAKKLTRAEIEKALRDGAKPGVKNQIPDDEISRCLVLVRRAMYEAWEQPSTGDAGSRPTLLTIRLDNSGRLVSYRISQSSGSAFFDQTVLKAAANVAPIRGLSLAFLKQFEDMSIEFKLE